MKKYALFPEWTKRPDYYVIKNLSKEQSHNRQYELLNSGIIGEANVIFDPNANMFGLIISDAFLQLLTEEENKYIEKMIIPIQIQPYIPPIYRYLEKEYVDEFFETGKLRLSSFKQFSKHDDEQRQDKQEGRGKIVMHIKDTDIRIEMEKGTKDNAYVLCGSLIYVDKLRADFKCDSCFLIEEPLLFTQVISLKLENCVNIVLGPCSYSEEKMINAVDIPKEEYDMMFPEGFNSGKMDFNAMFNLGMNRIGNSLLFKKLDKYSHQHEYRILWRIDAPKTQDHIYIYAPEAIKYCRRIK